MSKKGIRVRYSELVTLLSIFKVIVNMNKNIYRNAKCELCFWIFDSKFSFRRAMCFTYLEALGNAL